jgi:Xaa-Pro aminopeptidase
VARDNDRAERLREGLKQAGLDAVAVSLPENVLLATGYYPVVGTSLALIAREGDNLLFVPQDELDLARQAGVENPIPFQPASLDRILSAVEAIRDPVRHAIEERHLGRAVIGYECGAAFEPASYASMHFYANSILDLFAGASLRPASEFLRRMKATLTAYEIDRVRRSCRIAELAFEEGRKRLVSGIMETEAAAAFRTPLFTAGVGFDGAARADGYTFCMAGAHSAEAFGAYARSRDTGIQPADFVLTHCNSHADGYWTDITRTYCIGPFDDRKRKVYDAVFEARDAAMAEVRPGARARDVDLAARKVMRAHGFGGNFKHPTGHGVGLAAIDHNALPRIHPQSEDYLESGMVFNIEPAAYFEGFGGLRHCGMVVVTQTGAEVLTPFQSRLEDLIR